MLEKKYVSYPFNGDLDSLRSVLANYSDCIREIYLPLPNERVGTPRQSKYDMESIDYRELFKLCSSYDVKINVLLNSAIREWIFYTEEWYRIIHEAVEEVIDIGIEDLTIGDLPLAMKLKKDFQWLKIHISATALINSIPKFNVWRQLLDVFEVCIDTSKNKDLDFIRQLKSYGVRIKLLVNENCFLDCPMRPVHQNMVALRIRSEDQFNCRVVCGDIKKARPWYIYQTGCLTPYVLYKHYSDLVDTVKLVGRSKESRDNVLTLENYLDRNSRTHFFREEGKNFHEADGIFEKVSSCDKNCEKCGFCEKIYIRSVQ